jgi:GNAT superfamily N-acetyltransferase
MIHEARRGEYLVSTDKALLELAVIHDFLRQSYWAKGVPLAVVERSMANSLCFGVYKQEQQVGFARVISDYATFAYLADVFILASCRGQGLSKWLMEMIVSHPQLQGLRKWMLATRDAHGLYRKFGFESIKAPDALMEQFFPEVYARKDG